MRVRFAIWLLRALVGAQTWFHAGEVLFVVGGEPVALLGADDLRLFEPLRARTEQHKLEQVAQSQAAEDQNNRERLLGIGGRGATDSTRALNNEDRPRVRC